MLRITTAVKRILGELELAYWQDKYNHPKMIRIICSGNNGYWMGDIYVDEEAKLLVFYSVCPIKVPEEKFAKMTEFLTRINWDLLIGSFDMNYKYREVKYKTSINLEGIRVKNTSMKNLISENLLNMDKYLSGIIKVIYTDISVKEIIDEMKE